MKYKTVEELEIRFPKIPYHMLISLVAYRDNGRYVGGFLEALLSNDLMKALARADDNNIMALADYGKILYNDMPSDSWGSPEQYKAWLKQNGLKGV